MTSILIKNAYVITVDPQRRIYEKGAIAIDGNRIEAVGKSDDIVKKHGPDADEIIDVQGKAVLPGFINTHSHLFQTFMRSLGDDMEILDWWPHTVLPMALVMETEDFHYAHLVGCIESIKSGVTLTLDNQYIQTRPEFGDTGFEAWSKIGIRGIQATNGTVLDRWNLMPEHMVRTTEQIIGELRRLYDKWHGKADGRLQVWSGTGAPFTVTTEYLEECIYTTQELNDRNPALPVGMVGHWAESAREVQQFKQEMGKTPIQYYYDKGIRIWCDRMIAIHAVHLTDAELDIFEKTDTRVSHNALSNQYLASGVARVPEMLQRGIKVSLGLDGPASNNGQDMMEAIKSTVMMHKVATQNPTIMTAEKVLELATIDGARCINREHDLGSLEAGKLADLVVIDLWKSNMMPIHRPVSQIVYCGKAENIDTVIINGKIVLRDRVMQTVNEKEILEKAQKLCDAQVERAGEIPKAERKRPWMSVRK
ncbi:MAG: amidohydrolase family protein [Candidatus Ranarchaeia archaeon]